MMQIRTVRIYKLLGSPGPGKSGEIYKGPVTMVDVWTIKNVTSVSTFKGRLIEANVRGCQVDLSFSAIFVVLEVSQTTTEGVQPVGVVFVRKRGLLGFPLRSSRLSFTAVSDLFQKDLWHFSVQSIGVTLVLEDAEEPAAYHPADFTVLPPALCDTALRLRSNA